MAKYLLLVNLFITCGFLNTIPSKSLTRRMRHSESSATQPKSSAPLTSATPFENWHTRLGYPSEEAMRRLPASAEGVELTDTPTTDIPNESYEVANPTKHQISRRHPHQPPTRPFEILWVDLVHETIPGYDSSRWIPHYCCQLNDFAAKGIYQILSLQWLRISNVNLSLVPKKCIWTSNRHLF
jgi:hypothetical protein